MNWKNIKLRNKLYLGFCIILGLLVFTSILSYTGTGKIKIQAQSVILGNQIDSMLAQKEIEHLNWFTKVNELWTDSKTMQIDAQTDDHKCGFGNWLFGEERRKLESLYPDLSGLLKDIEFPHRELHDSITEINRLMAEHTAKEDGLEGATVILNRKTIPSLHKVQEIMHAVRKSVRDKIISDEAMIKKVQDLQRNVSILAVASVIAGLLFAFLISSSISGPIGRAIEFAKKMAEGDFTKTLAIEQKDEVGLLADAMNILVTSLGKMFREINNGAYTLNASSTNLSAISEQMKQGADQTSGRANTVAAAAEEMSTNMNNVAAASEEASTNVNMVATAAEEMGATINEIARNTETARVITDTAVSKTKDASEKVDELGIAASDINKVTETINEISEQTNLLALNATIEAARAGEAGKGFAVVAEEIKGLAKQTAEATLEIKGKIEGIQTSTDKTINNIKDISKINIEVSEIVTSIANAIEEQSVATREIASNVSQASEGIQEVNINVSQSASVSNEISMEIAGVRVSADEISTGSRQIDISAHDLNKIAVRQLKIIKQFKIPDAIFDIESVKGAHLQWRSKLEGLLHGKHSLKPEEVTNHHQCDFGKWYDGPDGQKLKDIGIFKEVGQYHEKVHTYARRIVEMVHNGEKEQAELLMKDFEKERGNLFESLNELYLH